MTAAALIAMLAVSGAPNCPPGNTNPQCPNNVNRQHQQQQEDLQRQRQAEQQRQQEAQRRAQEDHARQQEQLQRQAEQQQRQQAEAQRQQAEAQRQQAEQQRRAQDEHARAQDQLLRQQEEQRRAEQQQRAQQNEQQRRAQDEHARQQEELLKQRGVQEQQREQQQRMQNEADRRAQDERAREQQQQRHADPNRHEDRNQHGPPPPPGRGPEYAAPGRPPPPPARARPVQLRTGATVVAQPGRGLSVTRRNNDGSELVVRTHYRPDGVRAVTGYRVTRDANTGAQTRQYFNGARVITARDYVSRMTPSGITYTRRNDGLHECTGRDGRPVYNERYRTYVAPDGRQGQAIERTVYVRTWRGRVERLPRPVVETYRPVYYGSGTYYSYVPTVWQPTYYRPFTTTFRRPIVVAPTCLICPTPVVVWETPVVSYVDPVVLLADLMITSAVDDAYYADSAPPQVDPNTAALQQQVYSLQQEVDSEAQSNEELRAQLADQQMQLDAMRTQQQMGDLSAPPPPPPMPVPEDARVQLRAQVSADLELHQQQQPLMLPDVLASQDAQSYVFQIADPLEVVDAYSQEECNVTSGDLLRFYAVPSEADQYAQMSVITSRQGGCRAGSVIYVSMNDLQQMLNSFSQRLEQNVSKVHDQVAGR